MQLQVFRFSYCPTETEAWLRIGDWSCFTMEPPWIRGPARGGLPFKSCIPDGTYRLVPHRRQNGDRVFAMVNEDLGVYYLKDDRPDGEGRFLCLIHRANFASELRGCIAPGRERAISDTKLARMVTDSGDTMDAILERVPWVDGHTLTIAPIVGAIDTPLALPATSP